MQGPGQPAPGRRAGDSGPSGPEGGNLKDWQKNTWFGPAPANSNPFEEPESAPELLEARSSNVSNHTGSFWKDQEQTGYQYSAGEMNRQEKKTGGRYPKQRNGERRIPLKTIGIIVALLIASFLVIWFGVFRIREIRVVGNNSVPSADIIRFSGIRKGGSILQLSEDETERRMIAAAVSAANERGNYNYYKLQFRYLEKELPGTVTIAVHEREACCFVIWCGIMYVMDKNGTVLYESEDPAMPEQVMLVEVKGLDIRAGAHVGQTIVLSSAAQELIFRDLFLEMKVLGYTDRIREADLSNPSSLLLTTRDNFTVSLGNSDSLHAKLRSMMLVLDKLKEMGQTAGSVSVDNPEAPFYSPDSPN